MSSHEEITDPLRDVAPHSATLPNDFVEKQAKGSVTSFFIPSGNQVALWGYYVAIFSLIPGLGLVLGPLAVVYGIQGLCLSTLHPEIRGGLHATFAIGVGLVVSIVNWVLLVLVAVGLLLFMPPPPA